MFRMFYAPDQNGTQAGTTTVPAPAPELTSDKLAELKKQYATKWQEMLKMTDPFSQETKDAKLAVWKIEGEMKAEIQSLQKAANDAKVAEQRNQRLKLNQVQLDAFAALNVIKADKKADPAKLAEAQTAFDTAKEAVDNELLAKYAASKSAKSAGDKSAENGESSANKAAILELFHAGKSQKEIENAGFARSTVWHTINNFKKANQQ